MARPSKRVPDQKAPCAKIGNKEDAARRAQCHRRINLCRGRARRIFPSSIFPAATRKIHFHFADRGSANNTSKYPPIAALFWFRGSSRREVEPTPSPGPAAAGHPGSACSRPATGATPAAPTRAALREKYFHWHHVSK